MHKDGFRQIWWLVVRQNGCPSEVVNEVRNLWQYFKLGNDHFIHKTTLRDLLEFQEEEHQMLQWRDNRWVKEPLKTECIRQYVKEKNPDFSENETFLIHWGF